MKKATPWPEKAAEEGTDVYLKSESVDSQEYIDNDNVYTDNEGRYSWAGPEGIQDLRVGNDSLPSISFSPSVVDNVGFEPPTGSETSPPITNPARLLVDRCEEPVKWYGLPLQEDIPPHLNVDGIGNAPAVDTELDIDSLIDSLPEILPEGIAEQVELIEKVVEASQDFSVLRRGLVASALKHKYPSLNLNDLKAALKSAQRRGNVSEDFPAPTDPEELKANIGTIRLMQGGRAEQRHLMMAEQMVAYLDSRDWKGFYSDEMAPRLIVDGKEYEVGGKEQVFAAFLFETAGVNAASSEGKAIIQRIRNRIVSHGKKVRMVCGQHTDLTTDTIYFHLGNGRGEILKISPSRIEIITNAEIEADVFILKSGMMPLEFIPDVDVRLAMTRLKETVFDQILCSREERYFILSFGLTYLLRDYTRNQTIMDLVGGSGEGKSAAAEILTTLVMGKPNLEGSRKVSDLMIKGTTDSVIVLENLENENINECLRRFLLSQASGITSTKRKNYTDSGQVQHRPSCLFALTSIDPFDDFELLNRTFSIKISKAGEGGVFDKTGVIEAILRDRNLIFSALFRILAKDILPEIKQSKAVVMEHLGKQYPGHFTQRCDEFTALAFLWGRALLAFFEEKGAEQEQALDLLDSWVTTQDQRGRQLLTESSPLITLFSALGDEINAQSVYSMKTRYGIKIEEDEDNDGRKRYWFEIAGRKLLPVLKQMARKAGIRQPYENATLLMARIRSEEGLLGGIGWQIETGTNMAHGGIQKHRFTFTR